MHSDTAASPLFYGRFSDGRTAGATDVDVRLGASGVEVMRKGALPLVWPYAGLVAAEPLSSYAVDALLSSPASPGASLFVGEGLFARKLAEKAPHLTTRAQRWQHAKPWLLATLATVAAAIAVWALDLSPARTIAGLLPDRARSAVGEQIMTEMSGDRPQCDAGPGRAALDRLTTRLAEAAGDNTRFKVVVSDWDLMNAFAAPGEQILLTRGLIEKAQSADELAGVLAHEMGHGIERHPETALVRAIGLSAALELMMGGSSGTLANAGLFIAQLAYSRDAERAADAEALRILAKAGISAKGFASFFRRVQKEEEGSGLGKSLSSLEVLRTHPVTEERLRVVERTPDYKSTPALDEKEWAALKSICGAARPKPDKVRPAKPAPPPRDI